MTNEKKELKIVIKNLEAAIADANGLLRDLQQKLSEQPKAPTYEDVKAWHESLYHSDKEIYDISEGDECLSLSFSSQKNWEYARATIKKAQCVEYLNRGKQPAEIVFIPCLNTYFSATMSYIGESPCLYDYADYPTLVSMMGEDWEKSFWKE